MSKNYYEVSRDEVIKRLESIKNGDYVEFFRASDEFALAITLAYFSLAEELLIDRNSKNTDIATRFKKHIDDASLNGLLTEDITIRAKEDEGNSAEWFLSALRNGMLHNGFKVDYDNRVINVINAGALNKLDCSVTFDWFENFIRNGMILKRTFDAYKYTVVINPFIEQEYAPDISKSDLIEKFIKNDLLIYDIEVSFDENNADKTKLKRDDFIAFCHEKESLFWRWLNFPDKLSKDDLAKFESFMNTIQNRLDAEIGVRPEDGYSSRLCNELFVEWFASEFKEKFGNYNINISKFDLSSPKLNMVINGLSDNSLINRMFPTKKELDIFALQHPVFQRMNVARAVSQLVNYDAVDYLLAINWLFNMYDLNKGVVRDQYRLSEFVGRILNVERISPQQIQGEYLKAIHDGMVAEGVVHTYDKQITSSIIRSMNSNDEDIYVRCRNICGDQSGEFSEELIEKIGEVLKDEYPEQYKKISDELIRCGLPSDQVLSVYDENDLYRLCRVKDVINERLDEVIVGLLYVLGINTYVINKETVFAGLSDADYSFIDGLNIQGFSKDAYGKYEIIKGRKEKTGNYIEVINKSISGIEKSIEKMTDPAKITDKQNRIAVLQTDIKRLKQEQNMLESQLVNRVDENFAGINMSKLSNSECATKIRNCFAHSGRIFVEGREPGGEVKLVLTDYDENGNLSGVVKTDLSSMIKFFGNAVFKNEMDKKDAVTLESGKSK